MYNHLDLKRNMKSPIIMDTKDSIKEGMKIAKDLFIGKSGMDTSKCIEEMELERHMENRRIQALFNSTVSIKAEHLACINEWVTMNIMNEGYKAFDKKIYPLCCCYLGS